MVKKLLVASFLVLFSACSADPFVNLDAPREFFAKDKIGSSPDYGVVKFRHDHVITVHGFSDDRATCQEIVDALNFNACKEIGGRNCLDPYACERLN